MTFDLPRPIERFFAADTLAALAKFSAPRSAHLAQDRWAPCRTALEHLRRSTPTETFLDRPAVTVGRADDLDAVGHEHLARAIASLIPWRKGPFSLFGRHIDSEWRSDLKFDRIAGVLRESVPGARVLDVGCSNGYYMFRAAAFEPELVLGIDPLERNFLSFALVQQALRHPALCFELLSIAELAPLERSFDVVLCLGVIYHRPDPLLAIQQLKSIMRPGALLVMESQVIAGDKPIALFPDDRHGKARNVYFIPTVRVLTSWLRRSGFREVELLSLDKTGSEEQRRTEFAPGESLQDFLDPQDSERTVEGYPAPLRAALAARLS